MTTIDLSRLNEGQHAVATRLDEPLFVSAGAGSGKTATLTTRLAYALSEGSAADGGRYLDSVDQALVITFTEAAAQEIKERVRSTLREAGTRDAHLHEESLRVDEAWISTIHGMCSRILHRYGVELGIDPEFAVCAGSVEELLRARALDDVMAEVETDPAYVALRQAFDLWGTGASVAGMVERLQGEASKYLAGLDAFFCPASSEAASCVERVQAAFEALAALDVTDNQRAVLDSSCAALARFAALAPGERTAEAACETLAEVRMPPRLTRAAYQPLKQDAAAALAEAVVVAHYERVQPLAAQLLELARRFDARYGELKRAQSLLDNDDLIGCALRLVEEVPEVASELGGRFRLVMIDEFQDTDERQLRLISLLAGTDACHLTTVGDAQQSIYRFRGGDVEVFRARGAQLPQTAHVAMDVNYRSDPSVLALVERSCGDAGLLDDFLKLAADEGRESCYRAREADGSEPVRVSLEVVAGGNADLASATQAAMIADRLAHYHDLGQDMSDMALLLGVTSRVDLYLDALRARGLQAQVTGGSSFSRASEVGVVQALLHALSNPHDTQTGLFPLLSSDLFRLDADDFCQLGSRAQLDLDAPTKRPVETVFLSDDIELYHNERPSGRLRAAHAVMRRAYRRLGRWRLADICQAVLEESGWLARLEAQGIDGQAQAANVLAAVRYVRELTEEMGLGAARAADEFDRWLDATKIAPATLSGEKVDAVRVMTIHGSKGLEFPITAVAECWKNPSSAGQLVCGRVGERCALCVVPRSPDKSFSAQRKSLERPTEAKECRTVADWALYLEAREQAAEAQENARLLYVALTRAQEALVVGVPMSDSDQHLSDLAAGFVGGFPELDELVAGERLLDVNPERGIELQPRGAGADARFAAQIPAGRSRVVELQRPARKSGDPWRAYAAGTLAGFDGELPAAVSEIAVLGAVASAQDALDGAARPSADGHQADSFLVFEPATQSCREAQDAQTVACGWRPRAGVFSYSSAHALMEGLSGARDGARGEHPAASVGAGSQERSRPQLPTRRAQQAEAEGAAFSPDADKATNLGSAFHELAQTMVETRADHDPARLEALARTWHLSQRQHDSLQRAIARWEASSVRKEVWTHDLVRAEVPFFVRVASRYGDYVEGAIDLLATDAASSVALVVDYKTGDRTLTRAQIEDNHRMQANFYAWVMMSQGFEEVDCAFCCVEVDDGQGEPLVVRYHFDQRQLPDIGA